MAQAGMDNVPRRIVSTVVWMVHKIKLCKTNAWLGVRPYITSPNFEAFWIPSPFFINQHHVLKPPPPLIMSSVSLLENVTITKWQVR
jgi:hypothetical protein